MKFIDFIILFVGTIIVNMYNIINIYIYIYIYHNMYINYTNHTKQMLFIYYLIIYFYFV
jgi:hypothetical protein